MTSISPMPKPPSRRRVSAYEEFSQRSGVTVSMFRHRNRAYWAVHVTQGETVVAERLGPGIGEAVNASREAMARTLVRVVKELAPEVCRVFVNTRELEGMLDPHLSVDLTFAPAVARRAATAYFDKMESRLTSSIVVTSDASMGAGVNGAGLGWAVEYPLGPDPILGSTYVPHVKGIAQAEFLSLVSAVIETERRHQKYFGSANITLRSDSKAALRMMRETLLDVRACTRDDFDAEHLRLIQAAGRRLETADVSLEWVRGHSGDLANDYADRMAVAARRSSQLHTPTSAFASIREQIKADFASASQLALVAA